MWISGLSLISTLWWTIFLLATMPSSISECASSSHKILILLPMGANSHKNVFLPMADELGHRGHHVTFFSTLPPKAPMENVEEIFAPEIEDLLHSQLGSMFEVFRPNSILQSIVDYWTFGEKLCEKLMASETYLKEIWNSETSYDVILTSAIFNDCVLGKVYKTGAPLVIVSTLGPLSYISRQMGNPLALSSAPSTWTALSNKMSLSERLANFLTNEIYDLVYSFSTGPQTTGVLRRFLPDMPPVEDVYANASLMLLNTDLSVDYPRPLLPNFIPVGGMHCRPAKPLPEDLEEFVSKAGSRGFIYFSLGSNVKGVEMPKEAKGYFLDAFKEFPNYQILWKWEDTTIDGRTPPPHVKLAKWLPQQDVLGHGNIKLFMTQGGLLSTQEATYHGVPIVGIPIGADQLLNMRRSELAGVGVTLVWEELTSEKIVSSMRAVLDNKSYEESVFKRAEIMRDQQVRPVDTAAYWIEYVVRHKGAPHLKSSARELTWYQYRNLDVLAITSMIFLFIVMFPFVAAYLCCCWVPRRIFSGKLEEKQKRQ